MAPFCRDTSAAPAQPTRPAAGVRAAVSSQSVASFAARSLYRGSIDVVARQRATIAVASAGSGSSEDVHEAAVADRRDAQTERIDRWRLTG